VSDRVVSKVYGNIVSPYARKVYLTLEWKGLPFEAIEVLPHAESLPFAEISPLGKIPAFEDDRIRISDSSVICDYLESRYPEPPIYPRDPAKRAQALWLEEYADTRLQDLVLRGVVLERLIKPQVRGETTDEARLDDILSNRLPPELDYLERQLEERGASAEGWDRYLVGKALSIADLAITTGFINAKAADFEVDRTRWPRLADYLESIQSLPLFVERARLESEYLSRLG
jgi:glutathione S-transferase